MNPSDPSGKGWVLYSPAPEDALPAVETPTWVTEFESRARISIGDLEDFVPIPAVSHVGWNFAVLAGYVHSASLVAAALAPSGAHAMLFFQKSGAEFYRQERHLKATELGWFLFKLVQPVECVGDIEANLRHARPFLQQAGLFSGETEP